MKPFILCDVDGILVDFIDSYLVLHEELNGIKKTEADVTSFYFHECVATREQDAAIWRHIQRSPGFVYNLPVYDGAMDFLAELRQLGRVVACTSPANPLWTAERAQWLLDKAGFAKKDIVVASDKALVVGNFLIDDAVHNLDAWYESMCVNSQTYPKPILFDRPWNRSNTNLRRAKNYAQVLEIAKENS
jgi:5'(3')-deoxyribonucleotidase